MLMAEVRQQALEYLERVQASFEEKGFKAKLQVTLGKAAENIMEVARKEDADLIAMTTHGGTGSAAGSMGVWLTGL
jgi:nucleotide-binding universal stress UspA family protein